MRVDLNAGNAIPHGGADKSPPRTEPATAAAPEETRFSAKESSVTSLAATALQAPEARTAKVEALRSQIAAGRYQVPAHQIAASIVDQLRTSKSSGG